MIEPELFDLFFRSKVVFTPGKVVFCAGEQRPVVNKNKTKPQNLFQKIIVLLSVRKFTIYYNRKQLNVFKPAAATKAITEIITTADSTDEIAAGTYCPS